MAAHHIPTGNQGYRAGTGNGAPGRFFFAENRAKRRYLRRNAPDGVAFFVADPMPRRGRSMNAPATRHIPVLGVAAVAQLAPHDGGIYVDATFGAGGYSRMILDVAGTRVIGIDRDRSAISGGFDLVDPSDGRLTLVEDRFSHLAEVCADEGVTEIDGVVMDVGVSSMQLDEAGRGFSFRLDGPLDMRMGENGPDAADLVGEAADAGL